MKEDEKKERSDEEKTSDEERRVTMSKSLRGEMY
jgi:hypothetical protein